MPTFFLENQHGRWQGRVIAGCDEAGRGPLAGPVVAAALIIPASFAEIDLLNILQASLLAMARAVGALQKLHNLDAVLVDGNKSPALSCAAHAYVGGDGRSLSIAAASIVAKVTRDRLMAGMHQEFPQYGFVNHMGYGTPQHLEALRLHGPCPHHRQSFAPVRECYGNERKLATG
ncbi:MAG: ribonuclease HII [Proteobacteria bacterium]|nr:ribonuclease HII [Pseudomonadota bacterium]